ncbi:MAG TPA: CAAX prenyl protease-related protein [Verrucomicrobiae bacterium]|nr:CAAX prenyl protease-related protein [Verrucomicrobiae bacterium]
MDFLRKKFAASPEYVRVAPFVIFLVLTFFQSFHPPTGFHWAYLIKTLIGAWLVWEMRPFVSEMRWAVSWEAIVVGILVCVMWVGINGWYPKFSKPGPLHNPFVDFPGNAAAGWFFAMVHLLGSTFVVPPLEEVFFRSFLYRYFVRTDFQEMPLNRFHLLSFVVTAILFGAEHYEWLAGILCGFAFQGLVLRKNRLGDAITAHAITNFLLGVWVIWRGAWSFW